MNNFQVPSYSDKKFSGKIYGIILSGTLLWLILIFMAPFLMQFGETSEKISSLIYFFFSKTCHQMDERSFHIFENKFAVCSRCLSIYAGFLAGVLIYPFLNRINNTSFPKSYPLIISTSLVLADVILDKTGILQNTFFSRSATGFIFGAILPFYLIPGFVRFYFEVDSYLRKKFSPENQS